MHIITPMHGFYLEPVIFFCACKPPPFYNSPLFLERDWEEVKKVLTSFPTHKDYNTKFTNYSVYKTKNISKPREKKFSQASQPAKELTT
jgi:hypothetical protein